MPNKRLQALSLLIFEWEITSFLKTTFFREGAVCHNVLYYQQFSTACYQVILYANNYFEELPIVSSAFKQPLLVRTLVNPTMDLIPIDSYVNACN